MIGLSTSLELLQSLVKALRGQGFMFLFIFIMVWPCIYLLELIPSIALLIPIFAIEHWFLLREWQAARALGHLVNEITIQQFASYRRSCFAWHVAFSVFILPLAAQGMDVVNLIPGSGIYVIPGLLIASGICGLGYGYSESRSWRVVSHLFETTAKPEPDELIAGLAGADILMAWARNFKIMSWILIFLSAGLITIPLPAGPIGLIILFILNLNMVCTRGDGVSSVAKGFSWIITSRIGMEHV